jgi:hypothetical protein
MRFILTLAGAVALAAAASAVADHGERHDPKKPAEGTIRGEIVDLRAFLAEGKRGPKQADEAEAAIRGSAAAAVVADDGGVYVILIAGNEGREPLKYVAHNVEITGTVYEQGGTRGIFARSVKDLGDAPEPKEEKK